MNPIKLIPESNMPFDEVTSLYFEKGEVIDGTVNFDGNPADQWDADFDGTDFGLTALIDPNALIFARSRETSKEYEVKSIDFKTKTIECKKKFFKFDQCQLAVKIVPYEGK